MAMVQNSSKLTVKVIGRVPASQWYRYFPNPQKCEMGGCRFVFGDEAKQYDWLVVYTDLAKDPDSLLSVGSETLACSQENTLCVVAEPENVKLYPKAFTQQFSHILTAQTPEALPHPGRIYTQPALTWFYGWGFDGADHLDWKRISQPCSEKTKTISTVCSSKRQRHTLHNQRFLLTEDLRAFIPELDVYGHGVRAIADKSEALDDYKYHIAIENYSGKHHWTEKLSDSFIGCCLPFYSGCTNLEDYFPEESYCEIDLSDAEKTAEIIKQAMQDDLYEKGQSAIKESRRLVLEEYNFFAVIAKIITQRHSTATDQGAVFYNNAGIRLRNPLSTLPGLVGTEVKKVMSRFKP